MAFHEECLERARPVWEAILAHPFLRETAACRIPDAVFANWLQQDYLFVRGGVRFLATLSGRAPESVAVKLAGAIPALEAELELFARMAAERQIGLERIATAPTCHAYVQFLLATAHTASFEEGFTLLYGAEKAYLDSWEWVRRNLAGVSPWQPFIERWSGEDFKQWVGWIEATLDELAEEASPSLRAGMLEIFCLTARYELRFWEMAYRGEVWEA
jgi:thiaminase/transcriptional activator TenA